MGPFLSSFLGLAWDEVGCARSLRAAVRAAKKERKGNKKREQATTSQKERSEKWFWTGSHGNAGPRSLTGGVFFETKTLPFRQNGRPLIPLVVRE
jgi:hypothetical protein